MKLVNTRDLKSLAARLRGSSPLPPTTTVPKMICPICGSRDLSVNRTEMKVTGIVRLRECEIGHKFITLETVIDLSKSASVKTSKTIPLPKLWSK